MQLDYLEFGKIKSGTDPLLSKLLLKDLLNRQLKGQIKMGWSLKRVTDPLTEPVTVPELKLQTHITHAIQDTTLESYIKAGRVLAENYQRRSYITQKWDIVLDSFPDGEIFLLRGPIISVESITVTDIDGTATVMDLSDFIILIDNTPARLKLKSTASWPSVILQDIGGIRIKYTTGYGDADKVPDTVKHAILLFGAFADDNRAVETTEIPDAFYNLLEPDRIYTDSPV